MLRWLRSHLTFANVVSMMALFVALGGGAYALTLPKNSVGAKQLKKNAVTGSKIRKGAVTSTKVKDHSLLAKDFRPGQLPHGPQGPQGVPGPKGDAGSRGVSAWDTIPSGQTVRGSEAIELPSGGSGASYTTTIALPARAPQPLVNADVNFAADADPLTTDDDATCTGSSAAPTAPAGKVCLYAASLSGVNSVAGLAQVVGGDTSFRVVWNSAVAAPNDMFMTFTWAYTAP